MEEKAISGNPAPWWSAELFNSPLYSDLAITCEGRKFFAHKNVLCTQSKFFASACKSEWKEGQEGVIDLPEDGIEIVEAMLRFLYCGDYCDNIADYPEDTPKLTFHVRIHVVAAKYSIDKLCDLTATKMNVLTDVTDEELLENAQFLYNEAPPDVRSGWDVLLRKATINFAILFEGKQEKLKKISEKAPDFITDVLMSIHQKAKQTEEAVNVLKRRWDERESRLGGLKRLSCSDCGKIWVISAYTLQSNQKWLKCPFGNCNTMNIIEDAERKAGPI